MPKEENPREISRCTTEPQTQILVSKDHQNSEAKTKRWMKNRPGGDPKHCSSTRMKIAITIRDERISSLKLRKRWTKSGHKREKEM